MLSIIAIDRQTDETVNFRFTCQKYIGKALGIKWPRFGDLNYFRKHPRQNTFQIDLPTLPTALICLRLTMFLAATFLELSTATKTTLYFRFTTHIHA